MAKLAKRWDCGARRDCPKDCLAAARPLPACPSTGTGVCCKDGRLYPNDCLAKVRGKVFVIHCVAATREAAYRGSMRSRAAAMKRRAPGQTKSLPVM